MAIGKIDCDLDWIDHSLLNCWSYRTFKTFDIAVDGHCVWRLIGEKLGHVGIYYKNEIQFGLEDYWRKMKTFRKIEP